MTNKIHILDCTLRDGGYINNWQFGEEGIRFILSKLHEAGIDMIEAGFISAKEPTIEGRSLYTSFEQVNQLISPNNQNAIACMINYGAYPIAAIPTYSGQGVHTIRIAFHHKDYKDAMAYCEQLIQKGYHVFVQPMATTDYQTEELNWLLTEANRIQPAAVYIVDSFGTMQQKDVNCLYQQYANRLSKHIAIGFHSHNNLQLSFPNAQELLRQPSEHDLFIDSSVFGMGRGAGNLCTELLTMYLNESYRTHYQLVPILEIIDSYLNAIFIKTPWGYSVPYYVASINKCHPNYATYLINKQTLGVRPINVILSQIPQDKKHSYDQTLIEQLYLQYQACVVDDGELLALLQKKWGNRKILLLAPGKSIVSFLDKIDQFITTEKPVVISINFLPEHYAIDHLFLSNTKRFAQMSELENQNVIATSNIINDQFMHVDYASLIHPGQSESDNAGLMLLRLLTRIGAKDVYMAGYDGFSEDIHENYCDEQLINSSVTEIFTERNHSVGEQLLSIMKQINVHFLTPSRYV